MMNRPDDAPHSEHERYLLQVMEWNRKIGTLSRINQVVLRVAAGTLGAFPPDFFRAAVSIYDHPDLPSALAKGGGWMSGATINLAGAKLAKAVGKAKQLACCDPGLQDILLVDFWRSLRPEQVRAIEALARQRLEALNPVNAGWYSYSFEMDAHDARVRDLISLCRLSTEGLPPLTHREKDLLERMKEKRPSSQFIEAITEAGLVAHQIEDPSNKASMRFAAAVDEVGHAFLRGLPVTQMLDEMERCIAGGSFRVDSPDWSAGIFYLAMAGRFESAKELCSASTSTEPLIFGEPLIAALCGDPGPLWELVRDRKWGAGGHEVPPPMRGLTGALLLWLGAMALHAGRWKSLPPALPRLSSAARGEHVLIDMLHDVASLLRAEAKGDANANRKATELATEWRNAPTSVGCFIGTPLLWSGRLQGTAQVRARLAKDAAQLESLGWKWLALQTAGLSLACGNKAEILRVRRLGKELNARPLHELVSVQPAWERRLRALLALADRRAGKATKATKAPPKATRLIWILNLDDDGALYDLRGATQTRDSKSGAWANPKTIARPRMVKNRGADIPDATEADRLAMGFLRKSPDSYYSYVEYGWDPRVLTALCGHPAVYLGEAIEARRVELVAEKPRLRVERVGTSYTVAMVPNPTGRRDEVVALPLGPRRLGVYTFTKEDRELAALLDAETLSIPEEGAALIGELVESLAPLVPLESEGLKEELGATQPAEVSPFLGLEPYDTGVQLRVLLRPFGPEGAVFTPTMGSQMMTAEREGRSVRLLRDFKAEEAAAAALLDRLPQFAGLDGRECDWTWPVIDPQAALELVDALEDLRATVPIEWPEHVKPMTTRRADLPAMRVQVTTAGDWFALSGQVEVEPGTLLEMTALLERWDERRGRFVPLGDGRWLALSRRLQQRVEEMRSLAHAETRDGLRLHGLAPLAAPGLLKGMGEAALADEWRRRAKRWEEAGKLDLAVPSTLQAELRPYQEEGFRWLARLAHAGAGACLADDMGLGKTLQALALLLNRAAEGPALVMAPASVTPNWIAEAARFAPTLRVIPFGAGDRAGTIREAGPYDVVVASYGILATESELLASRPWHTLLLDEAQAIKNQQTLRSQAVMEIRADFRLALTGTPLENHLGELWNLFRFLNPGLLGSRERFENRFAQPIERLKDRAAMANLKRVIGPFIMRRTKQEVLPDLPPATEITLKVPMEPAERALYEAVREQALRTLGDVGQESTARVRILAEIMRLRRACCHPTLLAPDCGLSGSKMAEFLRLVTELRDNRHRALVFSQFVDHLGLLRGALDKAGITYQYLDGSTPIAARETAVRRFQGGEGDLFLISLKAGGTGLNLTAADYVIHMDPWWNPAVEDQASARAHRIGQDRPVTIYRLVMENSIEERIVALHHAKRRMADDLLDEASQGSRLSAQELLALIRLH